MKQAATKWSSAEELKLLKLVSEGTSTDSIAARLGRSEKSIERKISRIYRAGGMKSDDERTPEEREQEELDEITALLREHTAELRPVRRK